MSLFLRLVFPHQTLLPFLLKNWNLKRKSSIFMIHLGTKLLMPQRLPPSPRIRFRYKIMFWQRGRKEKGWISSSFLYLPYFLTLRRYVSVFLFIETLIIFIIICSYLPSSNNLSLSFSVHSNHKSLSEIFSICRWTKRLYWKMRVIT